MPIRPRYSERQRAHEPRSVESVGDVTKNSLNAVTQAIVFNSNGRHVGSISCSHCFEVYEPDIDTTRQRVSIELGNIAEIYLNKLFPSNESEDVFNLVEIYCEMISDYRSSFEDCRNPVNCMMIHKLYSYITGVNQVLERDKIAYELNERGEIERLGTLIMSDLVRDAIFKTGDDELNELFEVARDKFISRHPAVRREGLEKLWDAWERLKTLEVPGDKKASTSALLDRVADGPMRERLETEAKELTAIGNKFRIRHSETDSIPIEDDRHVDYLFHRMFSLVYLLLDATGRVGRG